MKVITKYLLRFFFVLFLINILSFSVLAVRVPNVGQDNGAWGTLINDYLAVVHDSGGSLKGSSVGSNQISDIAIQAIDINVSVVNATHILDATIGAIDIASSVVNTTHLVDNTILGVDIANATIEAIDIASGIINTTHIVAGGLTGNAIASGIINTTHILDNTILGVDIANATIEAIDIASNAINTTHIAIAGLGGNALANNIINTTHIVAGGLTGNAISSYTINSSHIAVSSINGSQISNTAALNVTSLAVTGVNRTATGVPYPYFNISGIFFNRTIYDLPSTTVGDCPIVNVNMTGIPANSLCIFVGGDDILLPNVQSGATVNLTFTGINSTAGNCRVRVCNGGLTTADPGILTFAAIGIAGNGL